MMSLAGTFSPLRSISRVALLVAVLAVHTGCSSSDDGSGGDGDATGDGDARTFEDQVADGSALYGTHCAHCHGDAGQGTEDGPQVVGEGALPLDPPEERMVRTTQFVTAADIFAFARENMPGDDPGALTTQEMVDVLAFALFANGVTLEEPLSTENAGDIVVNAVE